MFEHTRSFGLKKICALKGWRLVISCLHKSHCHSFNWTRRNGFVDITCKVSKNATAPNRWSSHILIFAGVKRNPQQQNLRCVREGASMSWFSNEWHLWVSAKYLIIGSSSVCKDNIKWSAFNLKNSNLDLFIVRTTALGKPLSIWLMPLLTEGSRICVVLFHHVSIWMQTVQTCKCWRFFMPFLWSQSKFP